MCSSMPASMSPEDRIVSLLSHWLARHIGDDELRAGLEQAGRKGLSGEQAEAVDELVAELDSTGRTGRGDLERLARETLEALALG
jgi:hypothetical protein